MEIPVYLFTGFLESGKTTFIQETLADKRFNKGERTLLLLCEEGEEEYDPEKFAGKNVFLRTIEDEEDLTEETLARLVTETKAKRVVLEYNGMWPLTTLYQNMPREWAIYQQFLFVDATTFLTYNANMRSLVVDKLQGSELVVVNRVTPETDRMTIHKIVRATNRQCDIAYESPDHQVEYDEIEDPLPFDVNAPVIDIGDRDYALWYRDLSENLANYNGKMVKFRGMVIKDQSIPAGSFVVGRGIMTCCADDVRFGGLACDWNGANTLKNQDWVIVTAKIVLKNHKAYGKKGPVLTEAQVVMTSAPEEEFASFY